MALFLIGHMLPLTKITFSIDMKEIIVLENMTIDMTGYS